MALRSVALMVAAVLVTFSAAVVGAADDVEFIGSSIANSAVDEALMEQLSGLAIKKNCQNGSFPIYWFCQTYKEVRKSAPPKAIAILFRMNFLTSPQVRAYGANDKYKSGSKYSPSVDACIGTDQALKNIIYGKIYDVIPRTEDENYAGHYPWDTVGSWDFAQSVEASLLPNYIEECVSHGVKLILIRHKSALFSWEPQNEPAHVEVYNKAFTEYAQSKGARYIDLARAPEHLKTWYKLQSKAPAEYDDHLCDGSSPCFGSTTNSSDGQKAWTTFMAPILKDIMSGKRATYELTDPAQFKTPAARTVAPVRRNRQPVLLSRDGKLVTAPAGASRPTVVGVGGRVTMGKGAGTRIVRYVLDGVVHTRRVPVVR